MSGQYPPTQHWYDRLIESQGFEDRPLEIIPSGTRRRMVCRPTSEWERLKRVEEAATAVYVDWSYGLSCWNGMERLGAAFEAAAPSRRTLCRIASEWERLKRIEEAAEDAHSDWACGINDGKAMERLRVALGREVAP